MNDSLRAVAAPPAVFRLGREPDPWAWPDWAYATDEGTFGNRYDDPFGAYRVLYAATQRRGCFVETLARFRPDPVVVAELAEIDSDPGDGAGIAAAGTVPARWLNGRSVGRGRLVGDFFDVGHSASLAWLREMLASRLVHYGLSDLDASTVRLGAPRRFTQELGRLVYEQAGERGDRRFAGVRYGSRLGDEIENWALFEPGEIFETERAKPTRDDPDLLAALEQLGLRLG